MRFFVLSLCLLIPLSAAAQSGEEILKKVDENLTFDSRITSIRMEIKKAGSAPDVKVMKSWSEGHDKSYSVFEAPARDKGTRYLKLHDNLYMVLPRSEKIVKISGHMLRQGMMDSDFSYEDFMEQRALFDDYHVKIDAEEERDGHLCYVLELTEKQAGTTYPRRRIWVTKEHSVPIYSERYAKSGKLLKTLKQSDIRPFGDRHYPVKLEMRDMLRKGGATTVEMTDVEFSATMPPKIFSRQGLKRGR